MTKRMLIDSTHAEETRVVVLDGNRLEDYDVETSTKRQLKGNIYLAKVVRVEPSLQAAFVEYGGNRHGFLAFGEIHPDYYQLPVADRQRLLEMQEAEAREDEAAEDEEARGERAPAALHASQADLGPLSLDPDDVLPGMAADDADNGRAEFDAGDGAAAPLEHADDPAGDPSDTIVSAAPPPPDPAEFDPAEPHLAEPRVENDLDAPEQVGGDTDAVEEAAERRPSPRFLRNYKIQEVIRRRQILLIQVVKEERGTKGAALTTYISLAGRFSVLMPNSPRSGGISRKITSAADRRRLKEVTAELDLPRGMGMIVRTAGANRPKPEILRDGEYLLDQWDQIRDLTMRSTAPALIYEEANLIKRSIRDVYSRDVEDILVDGEAGWRAARDFMRMLMPTHARKVQLWKEPVPLFAKQQVEAQLDAMLSPTVQLKSGGYLVINQTEALVAIDVNSGRSTRERGIEQTALGTNLEAADEVARQLRLRDLAGLIVIDFIDMEARRSNAMVEARLSNALKADRARIQVGSISQFGLLEMSRQRLRPSLAETSFVACPSCGGTGHVRSTESAALHVLRGIEEEGAKRRAAEVVVHVASAIALYILNHKRGRLAEIESRYGLRVAFASDDTLLPPAMRIDRVRAAVASELPPPVSQLAPNADLEPDDAPDEEDLPDEAEPDEPGEAEAADVAPPGETAEEGQVRRKRRRRRGRGRREDGAVAPADPASDPAGASQAEADARDEPDAGDLPASAPVGIEIVAAPPPAFDADADPESGTMPERPTVGAPLDGEAAGPDDEARTKRRGRRGGRRRRRDGPEGAEAAVAAEAEIEPDDAPQARPDPAYAAPAYSGPTPADPFGGSQAFDIFDAIEQAEQQRAAAEAAPRPSPRPAPPAIEPAVPTAAEPEPDGVAAEPLPDLDPAQAAPATAGTPPVLVGADPPGAEKKCGWWRR